jgi:hypothetical protein
VKSLGVGLQGVETYTNHLFGNTFIFRYWLQRNPLSIEDSIIAECEAFHSCDFFRGFISVLLRTCNVNGDNFESAIEGWQ